MLRTAMALALALAPVAATAQDDATTQAFMACVADIDMDALDARMTAFTEETRVKERIEALCDAGDPAAAAALATSLTEELFAGDDPDVAAFGACLESHGMMEAFDPADMCDPPPGD